MLTLQMIGQMTNNPTPITHGDNIAEHLDSIPLTRVY